VSTTTPALDEPPIPPLNLLLITAAMMSVSILPALDMTVANVALPHMQGAISASQEQIAWVLTSYVIATAIAMPFSGWLAERFGRSQVLVWSVAGFTLSSVFCGLSTSLGQIVISRLLQGAFGASMIPLSQAVIIQYYPPHRVRRGLAIWSSGTMIAPIIGPTLGGLLTDTVGWQWIFYLNVPIGLVSIMSILAILPRDKPQTDRQLDFFGFASLSLAVGALQALLDRGQQLDWFNSVEIHVEASIALIAATYFIVHTLTTRERSFFDRRLISDRNYATCMVGMAIGGGILSTTRALFPLMLQGLFLYSAYDAGMVMAPSGIGSVIAISLFARWANDIDNRIFIAIGAALVAYSMWLMIGYNLQAEQDLVVWANLIGGAGMILFMSPMSAMAFSTLPHSLLNEGGTFFYLARNLGGSFAIAISQAMLIRTSTAMHMSLSEHVTAYDSRITDLPVATELAATILNNEITRQASMVGYIDIFLLWLVVILAAAPFILLLRSRAHTETSVTVME
jgi:DHA2 family multidrug resistance protein